MHTAVKRLLPSVSRGVRRSLSDRGRRLSSIRWPSRSTHGVSTSRRSPQRHIHGFSCAHQAVDRLDGDPIYASSPSADALEALPTLSPSAHHAASLREDAPRSPYPDDIHLARLRRSQGQRDPIPSDLSCRCDLEQHPPLAGREVLPGRRPR